ncbi:unnamed protein product [Parnassius apollo]|uniref:(apollo) hypothetical protein n=1 Tax=Parnassius apollo TaxID=110799 RepID=A0A8S3WUT7_PARAO|nr:unnamed protein product [Parnassius apollo]
MSKIPVDRSVKSRSLNINGVCFKDYSLIKSLRSGEIKSIDIRKRIQTAESTSNHDVADRIFHTSYQSIIPKMSINLEKVVEQNPRILDLREKLNEITKKQDLKVDKRTKSFINDLTQQFSEDNESNESGPYSLLFDLQTDPTTSHKMVMGADTRKSHNDITSDNKPQSIKNITNPANKRIDRLPNVINFDDKPMKEFEYSCEKEVTIPDKKTFSTHSRSDLCLQLKSHIHQRPYETNLSPNDNSISRNNEENSLDDSLGILTPDQMDDICYLENAFSPTVEGLPIFCDSNDYKVSPDSGDTPSTDKTESNSAASTIQNETFESVSHKKTSSFGSSIVPIVSFKALEAQNKQDLKYDSNSINLYDKTFCVLLDSKTEFENCPESEKIDLYKSQELAQNLVDEEFMPSIHSSILEPASSIADTTVNLDIPLDTKIGLRNAPNRIEQTPSPEDLPLDNSEANGEISTYSQFSASTLHDSQTFSDSKTDYTKSMETSKVSNSFITSITSITSLDGYQGDGEMSRPISRSADHPMGPREDALDMDWQNVPVTRRVDPMTDSDFFTESDADGLDEHMQKGDRKAQVIDGALYGGKNGNTNAPLIVTRSEDSCMESSGVYTDFENHRASPVFLNVIKDMSPDSTPSPRSDCSQKNLSSNKLDTYFSNLEDTLEEQSNISHIIDDDSTPKNNSKRNSLNSEKDATTIKKFKEEKRTVTLKKYKMPKRDVPSKLKTLLVSRKTDAEPSVQNSPKLAKKTERRESFLKKSSIEIKSDYKTKTFKDIKSKVDCTLSLQRSQTACSVTRIQSSKSTNINTKPKSRHMRMRMEVGSVHGSGKSSLHSSQSDISTISTPLGKHSTSRFPLLSKYRFVYY